MGIVAQGKGFGWVTPTEIFDGGDPTGLVTNVVWSSWGGQKVVVTGISDYVAPNQRVSQGIRQPAITEVSRLLRQSGTAVTELV